MGNIMRNFAGKVAIATMIMPILAGCTGEKIAPLASTGMPSARAASGYHLGSGDKLRITVYNEPALTGEYSVTPAGAVAFPLIGTVNVADHTIEQVTTDITHRLDGGYVQDPRVSVEVLNFRPFYILGEVNKPGEYPYSSGLTVEKAVALAGGFTYRANARVVFVRRDNGPGEGSVQLRGTPVSVLPGDTIRIGERYF
jgi:polysaccharide export outer membrane protein